MGMRRLGTRHAPEVPNDHTNLTSTASDEHMRALVPHMRTQHAPSTGTTGWQRMDQAQTPDPYRENPGGGFQRGDPSREHDHMMRANRGLLYCAPNVVGILRSCLSPG